jgi:hypothetical protein
MAVSAVHIRNCPPLAAAFGSNFGERTNGAGQLC